MTELPRNPRSEDVLDVDSCLRWLCYQVADLDLDDSRFPKNARRAIDLARSLRNLLDMRKDGEQ